MNLNGFPEFKCKYQISVNLWGFFSLLGRGCFLSRDGEGGASFCFVLRDSGLMTGWREKPVPSPAEALGISLGTPFLWGQEQLMVGRGV